MKLFSKLSNYKLYAKAFLFDMDTYRKSKGDLYNEQNLKRWILLKIHSLEKGLAFDQPKKGWGHENAQVLIDQLGSYLNLKRQHDELSLIALNTLNQYIHNPAAQPTSRIIEQIEKLNHTFPIDEKIKSSGVIQVFKPDMFDKSAVEYFFGSRHSVRNYSTEPITDDEIKKALAFAQCTPTACNRQTSNVYVIRDKTKMSQVLDNQFGDQGWTNNASVLFVITANLSLFWGIHERRQPYIDGGLYAMNFVWGLHYTGIASCFRMFSAIPEKEKQFKVICNIPDNEAPIAMIAAGHYREQSSSPASERIDKEFILI